MSRIILPTQTELCDLARSIGALAVLSRRPAVMTVVAEWWACQEWAVAISLAGERDGWGNGTNHRVLSAKLTAKSARTEGRRARRWYVPCWVIRPSSDTGVMGEGLRFSEKDGEREPGEEEGVDCAEAISRYHRRQEIFSRRRPSLRDSLHFVKT